MIASMPSNPLLAAPHAAAAAEERASDYRALVRREGDALLRLAVRLAGTADGPDVLQDALVKAWLALEDGRAPGGGGEDTARWLARVVIHQAYDVIRARSRRRRWASLLALVVPMALRGEAVEASAEIVRLERVLETLTPEQRVVWVLKEVEGYAQAEIAALLGVAEGAVEQRLLRARANLQRRLHAGA